MEEPTQINSLNLQLWHQNEKIIFFVLHVSSTLCGLGWCKAKAPVQGGVTWQGWVAGTASEQWVMLVSWVATL